MIAEQVLLGLALERRSDVAGGDGDHVARARSTVRLGDRASSGHGISDAPGPEKVDLDRGVEGGVEGHRCRRVDDEIAGGQLGETLRVEAQAVLADVARHGHDPPCHVVGEGVAQLGAEPVEAVVADDLLHGAIKRSRPPARTDGEHHG